MKYIDLISFSHIFGHIKTLPPHKRQFPEAFVATVTKFAPQKKRIKEKKRKRWW
jgi:hypothetical protein